jgi:hypothetical protein
MKTKTNCKAGHPIYVERPNHNETIVGMRVQTAIKAGRKTGDLGDGSV